jgi:hypothetical protein
MKYESRLQNSWTHLTTPSRNFVEVRWRSLFRSTSLGKRCTSYNAPPTSRKRAADRWSLQNFLPRTPLFMVGKAQKSHRARSGLYGGCSNGVPPTSVSPSIATFQSRNADAPLRLLLYPEKGSFKTTVTPFSISEWSVVRSASPAKGGIRKRDRHRTSTKYRLFVIWWVHELCKCPSYIIQNSKHNVYHERQIIPLSLILRKALVMYVAPYIFNRPTWKLVPKCGAPIRKLIVRRPIYVTYTYVLLRNVLASRLVNFCCLSGCKVHTRIMGEINQSAISLLSLLPVSDFTSLLGLIVT